MNTILMSEAGVARAVVSLACCAPAAASHLGTAALWHTSIADHQGAIRQHCPQQRPPTLQREQVRPPRALLLRSWAPVLLPCTWRACQRRSCCAPTAATSITGLLASGRPFTEKREAGNKVLCTAA